MTRTVLARVRAWMTKPGLLAGLGVLLMNSVAAQPVPEVTVGRIERLASVPSRHVEPRHVDVWVPAACTATQRCQVLYMHDGQMLYDARTTWNKQAWNVHLTVDRLMREGRIPPTLVVGVWNAGPLRHSEYFPGKFLPHLTPERRQALVERALQGRSRSDAYLRFLVDELKPLVDARFPTRPEARHTAIMGSSMGGLISVYAMNEYPQVFGAAAGLSTHWVGVHEANASIPLSAFVYLRDHLAPPDGRRLYQDHGTTELDALYAPYQRIVDQIVRERGYSERDYRSLVFEGTGHNETVWAARLETPLLFVLGPR
jgi:enterochelin esterase-like enzyme